MTKKVEKLIWDIGDIDPTRIFPKDCRFYNGGFIAPPEPKIKSPRLIQTRQRSSIIFIDRLRPSS